MCCVLSAFYTFLSLACQSLVSLGYTTDECNIKRLYPPRRVVTQYTVDGRPPPLAPHSTSLAPRPSRDRVGLVTQCTVIVAIRALHLYPVFTVPVCRADFYYKLISNNIFICSLHKHTRNMCLSLTRVERYLVSMSRRCPGRRSTRRGVRACLPLTTEADLWRQQCVGCQTLVAAQHCSCRPWSPLRAYTIRVVAARVQRIAADGISSGPGHPARLHSIATSLVSLRHSRELEAPPHLCFIGLFTDGWGAAPYPPSGTALGTRGTVTFLLVCTYDMPFSIRINRA